MVRKNLSNFDASENATAELEYIIKTDDKYQVSVPTQTATEAMTGEKLFHLESSRNVTRVLFVSQDAELLNPTKQSLDGYVDISSLFDEVHILMMRTGIAPKKPVLRVSDNVWIYTATSKNWWSMPQAGIRMAESQLEFAGGFRPDLIVARDPFESAVVANKLAKKYSKPAQLHIMEDYSTAEFYNADPKNKWRLFIPPFTIGDFDSVRTSTDVIKNVVSKKFTIPDLQTLPRYQNYRQLGEDGEAVDLKAKYSPHIFFMLYIGRLDEKSNLPTIIDATYDILQNPRLCLIIIGDGPSRKEFEKKVKALGVEKQVIFLGKVQDTTSYLRSANVLLVGDTDFASEELVLQGSAVGIPMVMTVTEKRADIFENGKSAFLCEINDKWLFKTAVNQLLNSVALRKQFSMFGREVVAESFYKDPTQYMLAYRDSIEEAFFVDKDRRQTTD